MTRSTSDSSAAYAARVRARLHALCGDTDRSLPLLPSDCAPDAHRSTAGLSTYATRFSARQRAFLDGGSEALATVIAAQRAEVQMLAA